MSNFNEKSRASRGGHYDVAIIGAGPTALACLDGLPSGARIALVTGTTADMIHISRLHPKIQAVATERNEPGGAAELLPAISPGAKPLFSTASVGGLANYWGQQFVRFRESEPWPRQFFLNYDDYLSEARRIERLFTIKGSDPAELVLKRDCVAFKPRLLTGAYDAPEAGLLTMRTAVSRAATKAAAAIFNTRVDHIVRSAGEWSVVLDSDEKLSARRIIVAAGVVGSARILLRSFPLKAFRFADHSPWMLYSFGLKRLLSKVGQDDHFNALTIEKLSEPASFASVYDMGRAELNLILSSVLGRSWPCFRGWRAPPGASWLNPVQIWTPATVDEIEVTASGQVHAKTRPFDRASDDATLCILIDALKEAGGRPLKIDRAQPGTGFHYHDLHLICEDGITSASSYLATQTAGEVVIADASVLPTIGCRPHTLTAMASARRIASNVALC